MSKKPTPASAPGTVKPRRIDPFAHAGRPGWGAGGRYVIGPDGERRPAGEQTTQLVNKED